MPPTAAGAAQRCARPRGAYDRALVIQRALRAGLRDRAALAHRRSVYPHARRWNDGPCYAVALAARAAAREGIVVEVGRGHHAMLLVGGRWLVDPYGIRPAHLNSFWALGTHAFLRHRWACRWYPGRDRPDTVLVRPIRAALAKEQM